jgi:hypothetical protein
MAYTNKQKIGVITKAINILQNSKWIRGTSARDASGFGCDPSDKKACQFCAWGALAASTKSNNLANIVENEINDVLKIYSLPRFNDTVAKSKRDVIRLFQKTIKSLEKNS